MSKIIQQAKTLHSNGLAVIPTGERKIALGKGWQKLTGENRVEPNGNFEQSNVKGVGVITGTRHADRFLLAIDVDCYDKRISNAVCNYISEMVGREIPFRVGQAPKFLVPILCDEQSRKMTSAEFGTDIKSKIEVLGLGQQFVAYGEHPKGITGEYKWFNKQLTDLSVEDLPRLSMDQVRQVLNYFESLWIDAGEEPVRMGSNAAPIDDDDFTVGIAPPKLGLDLDQLKSMLEQIDPTDLPYEHRGWIDVAMALHHETDGSKAGYKLWVDWSRRSPKHGEKIDEREMFRKWKSFEGPKSRYITADLLTNLAGDQDLQSDIERLNRVSIAFESDPDAVIESRQRLFIPITDEYQAAEHIVKWTIEGYLERPVLCNFYGESGVGKSYLSISMGLCVATGREWLGKRTHKGKVLYVAGEGHGGVNRRVHAWRSQNGYPDCSDFIMTSRAINLTDSKDRKALERYMDSLDGLSMLVIDTWGRATAGINENSSEDVQPIIEYLAGLTRAYGCTVVVVHHTPKHTTDASAGSKNIKASMDVEMALVKYEGIDGVTLENRKMKEGPSPDPTIFKFVSVKLPSNYDDEYGNSTYSAVLELDATQSLSDKRKKLSAKGELTMKAFQYLDDHHPNMAVKTPVGVSVDHGVFQVESYGYNENVLKNQIKRMMDTDYSNVRDQLRRHVQNAIDAGRLVRYQDENDPENSVVCRLTTG